jgi:hypothetical protein
MNKITRFMKTMTNQVLWKSLFYQILHNKAT